MAKHEIPLTFTFVNPNTPKAFERQLQKILMDKLRAQYRDSRDYSGRLEGRGEGG